MHDAAKASADGYRDEGPLRIVVPTSSLCTILPDDANASTGLEENGLRISFRKELRGSYHNSLAPRFETALPFLCTKMSN